MVIIPSTMKPTPIAKMRESAKSILAHTAFIVAAQINKSANNTSAIPVMVSPLIHCFPTPPVIYLIYHSGCIIKLFNHPLDRKTANPSVHEPKYLYIARRPAHQYLAQYCGERRI